MTTNAFNNTTMPTNLAAIYARVSSDQQAQEQTIASQVAALRERVAGDGLTLTDELCFLDEGVCAGPANLPWTFVNCRDRYNPTNAHAEVE